MTMNILGTVFYFPWEKPICNTCGKKFHYYHSCNADAKAGSPSGAKVVVVKHRPDITHREATDLSPACRKVRNTDSIGRLFAVGFITVMIVALSSAYIATQPKPTDCFYDFQVSYECSQKSNEMFPNATWYLVPFVDNGQKNWLCCVHRDGRDDYQQGCVWMVKAC